MQFMMDLDWEREKKSGKKKTGSEFTLLIGRRTECEYKIHFFFGEIDVVTGIFFDSLHIRSNRLAHAGRIF